MYCSKCKANVEGRNVLSRIHCEFCNYRLDSDLNMMDESYGDDVL
jgi:hypothetical protein